jgi:hypothetical protein
MEDIFNIPPNQVICSLYAEFTKNKTQQLQNIINNWPTLVPQKYHKQHIEYFKKIVELNFAAGYLDSLSRNCQTFNYFVNLFMEYIQKNPETYGIPSEIVKEYFEEFIDKYKDEYIRIYHLTKFSPLDIYEQNDFLVKELTKVKKELLETKNQLSEVETIVLYLSKEIEQIKKLK